MSKDKEADQILDTLVGYVRMFLEHCKGYKYLNTRYFISSAMLWWAAEHIFMPVQRT